MKTDYKDIMWAEMKPNVYDGENFDQIKPQWECYADGDMQSDTTGDPIQLCCKTFPPGTRVVVSVPCCPKCDQEVELCTHDEGCDFNWEEWVEDKYS